MSKMTDEQIIKALECCIKHDCDECCLIDYSNDADVCQTKHMKETLDLINRQQAEIEKLSVELVGMRGSCNSYKMHYDNAKIEIESLKADKIIAERHEKDARELYKDVVIQLKTAKSEAIKEFAERLKEHLKGNGGLFCVTTMNAKIDNLVKEMVGEGK